jgi:hypothetical protein
MYIGLSNKSFLCNTGAKIHRSSRPICFFVVRYYSIQSYFEGVGHIPQERLVARRVRPDQRWGAGVGTRDGQPESSARKGRSLVVDEPCAIRAFPWGETRHDTCMWSVASEEAAR